MGVFGDEVGFIEGEVGFVEKYGVFGIFIFYGWRLGCECGELGGWFGGGGGCEGKGE